MTITSITPFVSTTPVRTQGKAAFDTNVDAFLAEIKVLAVELGVTIPETNTDIAIAVSSASAAAASASAVVWISEASYTAGDIVHSPVNFLSYRAKTTHDTVSTDPSADTTNWKLVTTTDEVNAIGSIGGGTQSIDLNLGTNVSGTIDTSTTTFTFDNPAPSGQGSGFTLTLTNAGSQTINWPASVDWGLATAPTLTTAGRDVLVFFSIDGGTIWYGGLAIRDAG